GCLRTGSPCRRVNRSRHRSGRSLRGLWARRSPGPSASACRRRRKARSGRWQAGTYSGGWSPPRWQSRRTAALSIGGRGNRWDGFRVCTGTDRGAPPRAWAGRPRCRAASGGPRRWWRSRARRRARGPIRSPPSTPAGDLWLGPSLHLNSIQLWLPVEDLLRRAVRRSVLDQALDQVGIIRQRPPHLVSGNFSRDLGGLLLEPFGRKLVAAAGGRQVLAVGLDGSPELVDAFGPGGRGRDDGWFPGLR